MRAIVFLVYVIALLVRLSVLLIVLDVICCVLPHRPSLVTCVR